MINGGGVGLLLNRMKRYSVSRGSEELGEFSAEEIRKRIQEGDLLESDLACPDASTDKSPLQKLPS